jgi:Ca2+-binding RTX toxin-like protein
VATFTAHSAFNPAAIPMLWDGSSEVIEATATAWTYGDADITYAYEGTGFTYIDDGYDMDDGTITGWSVEVDGTLLFALDGANYAMHGPDSPVGDIWDNGYLNETGYPVFGAEADLAFMLRGDDTVNGSAFADSLAGYEGDDHIFGNAGNDFIRGWHGNDTIDGGAGLDTAVYLGFRSDVFVTRKTGGFETATFLGIDDIDFVSNVERLVFNNHEAIALDMDGNAGRVVKLLGAVFGAQFVEVESVVGIGLQMADQGMSYEALASLAVSARGVFTHSAVVETLWLNLVGSPIDAANKAAFVGLLDNGMSAGTLAMLAAEESINLSNIDFAKLQQVGVSYTYTGDIGF